MFTGLIQDIGRIDGKRFISGGMALEVRHGFNGPLGIGASVAVNGVCLTVTSERRSMFAAECFYETINKTTLRELLPGAGVNLERALRADGTLEGHLVQGHVTGVVRVVSVEQKGRGRTLTVFLPKNGIDGLVPEGSVALDGVSLTISELSSDRLSVQLIGETMENTTLKDRRPGDQMNIETDFLLRSRQAVPEQRENKTELTSSRLAEWGYV